MLLIYLRYLLNKTYLKIKIANVNSRDMYEATKPRPVALLELLRNRTQMLDDTVVLDGRRLPQ